MMNISLIISLLFARWYRGLNAFSPASKCVRQHAIGSVTKVVWSLGSHENLSLPRQDSKLYSTNQNPPSDPPLGSHFFSRKELSDPSFRLDEEVFENLCKGALITRPSKIQSLAWPVILEGKHAIVADQTGSGKSLAYLLPLLQRGLKRGEGPRPNGSPSILVLTPTAELADQIREVCRKLATYEKFKTVVLTAAGMYNSSIRDQIRLIQRQRIDILISTPGRLSTILRTRNAGLDLSQLQSIVLDEVDVLLMDETFGPQLQMVGSLAPVDRTQFIFVTATLPDSVVDQIEKEFPGVAQIRGPGLHRVAPTINQRLVDVSVPMQYQRDPQFCFDVKAKQLLKALRQYRCRRTLIFCNTVESCRQVENLIKRKDRNGQIYDVRAYHNALTPETRNENLRVFANGLAQRNEVDFVLVCTDRAARGVDFDSSPVEHVIIFDFPKDPAEYVRRVGRTARAGRAGTTTVFAHGWQLPIARQVMGNKIDSNSMVASNLEDDIGEKKIKDGGKQNRQAVQDQIIRRTIENGTLWD